MRYRERRRSVINLHIRPLINSESTVTMTDIDRRTFLKQAAATSVAAAGVLHSVPPAGDVSTVVTHPVYIRSNIPAVEYPPHHGSWYDDRVPDTLDLAEMARLLVNGLTGPNDPNADYEQY